MERPRVLPYKDELDDNVRRYNGIAISLRGGPACRHCAKYVNKGDLYETFPKKHSRGWYRYAVHPSCVDALYESKRDWVCMRIGTRLDRTTTVERERAVAARKGKSAHMLLLLMELDLPRDVVLMIVVGACWLL
jgi:hypothetical protein